MTAPIYIALVHYPIVNKQGATVTTSVTNFDLHDLARTGTTYGVSKCFIVTPIEAQRKMVDYIRDYWGEGKGADFNPDRKRAFENMIVANSIEETCLTIQNLHGNAPDLIATTARKYENSISFKQLREQIQSNSKPILVLFGTGWGLHGDVLKTCTGILEPIVGPTDYNHLPVRSAVAIILDRLLGC